MANRIVCAAIVTGLALLPGRVKAEAIEKGTFALGAERITGMFHADEKVDPAPSAGTTTLALLGNGGNFGSAASAFQLPRVGLDGFIVDGLSLGGNLIVWHASTEGGSQTAFVIQPRVGFAFMFSRVVGIWPRGGIAYWNVSQSPDQGPSTSAHCFAFNLDVPLIIRPVRHFAITVGPVLDVGFAGKQEPPGGPNRDLSFTEFGLAVGMVAFL